MGSRRVAALLLSNRRMLEWPWLTHDRNGNRFPGRPGRKRANKFVAAAIVDYQDDADRVWERAAKRIEELGDPPELWKHLVGTFTPRQWQALWPAKLWHKFPKGHERVWRIGKQITTRYGGDARNIWRGRTPLETYERLMSIRVGPQISRMIVGALIDAREIRGKSDVKADIHVKRVLGRILKGRELNADEATEETRRLHPRNPWKLDEPLYTLGKTHCSKTEPKCEKCYMNTACAFYGRAGESP